MSTIKNKYLALIILIGLGLSCIPFSTVMAIDPSGGSAGSNPGATCKDGTEIPDSVLVGGRESDFCKDKGGYGSTDSEGPQDQGATCKDGTEIPDSVLVGGRESDFCKNKGGYSPPGGGTTNRGGTQSIPVVANDCNSRQLDKNNCGIIKYLVVLINIFSAVVGVVIVAAIIIGGIQYSTAGGDPQKVAGARKRITNAVTALILYIFMYTILQWLVPGGVF